MHLHAYLLCATLIACGFLGGFMAGRCSAPAGYVCGSNSIGAWCHQK